MSEEEEENYEESEDQDNEEDRVTGVEITVRFENGKWSVQPDPAVVTVGMPITWVLRGPRLTVPECLWTIYFRKGSPFHAQRGVPSPTVDELRVASRNTNLGTLVTRAPQALRALENAGINIDDIVDHQGVVGPVFAEEQGEYKYGIRVTNVANNEELGDDDPILIVR